MAYAERVFLLKRPQKGGGTLEQHLKSVWRQSGEKPPLLDVPELPDLAAHIWGWFKELDEGRGVDAMSGRMLPVTYNELKAWAELTGVTLSPFEVKTLKALDRVRTTPPADNEEGAEA